MARDLFAEMEKSRAAPRDLFAENKIAPEPKKAPESRNPFRVASDTVITIANSFAGGIEAAADYVSPGNAFSKAIDKFTKTTENLQSDMVKAGREKFQKDLEAAQTGGEEVAAVAKYIAENPLQAAGQAVGAFIGPGLAIKGSVKAAQLLKLTEKASSRVGLGAGVVTNAMMAGGDAGGSAYKMVMDTPDEILLKNDYIRSQVEKGISLEKVKEEAATTAARRASFIPSLIGGATGAFGVERFLAGVGGKAAASTLGGAIKTGLSEAAQEALEEGVTEYSGRSAAQTYDPRIDPMKGVAGAATMGAALGFIPGAGIGALQARNQLAADAVQKDMQAQQASAQAQETAAAIVPDAQAVQAQAEQATKTPANLPFGIATPEQIAAAINPPPSAPAAAAAPEADALAAVDAQLDAAAAAPQLPPASVKGETDEQKLIRYDAELSLGVNSTGKKLAPKAIENKIKARDGVVEKLGVENVERIRASATQPAGVDLAGNQPSVVSPPPELGLPSGEPTTPIDTGLDDTGGDAQPIITPATDQQPTLEAPPVDLFEREGMTDVIEAPEAIKAEEKRQEEKPAPAVDEEAALQAELAGVPAPAPVVKKKDYAATERVFKKEHMPFVTAKVDTRAAPPKNIDEAISHAGAETAFDQFDTALDSLKDTYAGQINAENKANTDRHNENQRLGIPSIKPETVTIYDILGRMTQSERKTAIDKVIDENKLKPEQLNKKKARDAFVKSLSESQKKAVDAKRKETIEAEIKAVSKLGKKSASDIRAARKKATAGTTVATAKKGKAQPVAAKKVEEKAESENIIERQTVEALRSGNTDTVLQAIKKGYTDPATKLFASRIEVVLSQFGIKPTVVVGKVTGNRPAMYDPATETITVDPTAPRDVSLDTVVLHEYAHFITDRAVDNPQSLTPIQKIALDNLNKLHKHVKAKLGKKYDIKTLKEFIAQSFSDSEFVAEMAKIPPATTVVRVQNALREFATRVMQLLGIKGDSASSQVLENIQTMITGPFEKGAKTPGKAEGVSFMAEPKEPKKAGEYTGKSTEEFIAGQRIPDKPKGFLASIFSWFTGSYTKRAKEAATKYQNEQYAVKDLQRQLNRTGLLVVGNETDANNIYDALSLAAGNFRNLQNTYVNVHLNKINEMLVDMVKKTGLTLDEVMQHLAAYGQVMHESEVRKVKYLKNVPLRSDDMAKNINWFGKMVPPATARDNIFVDLTSGGFEAKAESLGMSSKDLAKAYRKLLEDIVADKKNLDPGKDNKYVPQHDVNSDKYTVLAGLTPADVKNHIDNFNKNPEQKKIMDAVLKEVRELSDVTIMLNKQANYWSPQVDNLVNFYGYENYVTYKGKPVQEEDADLFYGGEQRLGKELQQREYTQEGRYTLPDNPILTMMADASIAAARSGRKDVTKTLDNLVKTGLVAGERKIVPFADRYKLKEDSELYKLMNRQNVFFHYMPNGEIAIISVKDEKLRNALRKTYKNDNALLDTVQYLTSRMGQMHTRFNVAFAPKNFVRDMLANAFNISVDMSPGAAANYVGSIANYITSNGLIKSGQVAKAFYDGGADPAKNPRIKALLAKDKSGHVKDLIDYLQNGGDIAYVSSFTSKGQFRDLLEQGQGPQGTALRTKEKIGKLFDVYQAGFEFTSRAAAFKIRKAEEMGKLMAKGMSRAEAEKAANKPAAAFAKGLANFEEKGLKARELGSWFMFFSASATGAVRVIEPLAPAISSVFGGYKKAADRAWSELPKELKDKGDKEEFTKKFIEQATRGKNTVAVISGVGAAMYYLAYAMTGEDDFGRNRVATDDMSRWMRDARFFVGDGVNDIITIPWGFGMGAFAALGAQFASLGVSDTKFTDVMANSVPILMDSFLPIPISKGSIKDNPLEFFVDSLMPAPVRPLVEFTMNYNSLGQEIYNNRQGPNGSVYTGGDNVPKLFKDASAFMFENFGARFGPNEMYFFASAYVDALSKAGVAGWNMFAIGTEGDRSAMERLKQDSLLFSGFIGTRSDYDARTWNKIEKDLKARSDMLSELEKANITAYYEYLADNPLDEFLATQYKKDAGGELKKLRSEGNEIRTNTDYDYATKRALLEMNRTEQTLLKKQLVDMYTAMGYEF